MSKEPDIGRQNPLLDLAERHADVLLFHWSGMADPAGASRMSWESALAMTRDTQPSGVDEDHRLVFRLQREEPEDGTSYLKVETHRHDMFLQAHRMLSAWYPVRLLETPPDDPRAGTKDGIELPSGPGAPHFRPGKLHLRGSKVLSWLRDHGAHGRHYIPGRGTWVDTAHATGDGATPRRAMLFDLRRATQECRRHTTAPGVAQREAASLAQGFDCIADLAVMEAAPRSRRRPTREHALGR